MKVNRLFPGRWLGVKDALGVSVNWERPA